MMMPEEVVEQALTMRNYAVVLTSKTPMIHHWDNLDFTAPVKWREDPANSQKSVAGDDRSPAFTWIGGLYHDGSVIAIPADNIMRCLMAAGAQVPVPGGKRGKTFKTQTQSGMMTGEPYWPLLVNGKTVPIKPILALMQEPDFEKHQEVVRSLGFELYVKRAVVGQRKHVRVRPRFNRWSAQGTVTVWDDQITLAALKDIFKIAGDYKGLGDWRPSAPKAPGPFGRFSVAITEQAEL